MSGVPADSHGGGLPLTGGTLTGDVTLTPPSGDTGDALTIHKQPGQSNGLWLDTPAVQAGGHLLHLGGDNGLANLASFGGGDAGYMYWTPDNAVPVIAAVTAPTDAQLDTPSVGTWYDPTTGAPKLALKAKDNAGTVFTSLHPLRGGVTGALATTTFVSGTGKQIDTAADRELIVPVTYNPTAGAAATCAVALSPDNATYSTVGTETEPAGVAFDGTIHLLRLLIPAAWYVRLTVVNAVIGTGTYY